MRIAAEPIERRLRHDQIRQHGLEDYSQWVNNLLQAGQVTTEEADILLQARSATARVVAVDDFTPEQMTGNQGVVRSTGATGKTVKKKSVAKKKRASRKK